MTLSLASVVFGMLCLAAAGMFLLPKSPLRANPIAWMRSVKLSIALFGAGGLWFLWHVWHLGEADFGTFRLPLSALFGATLVGSFFHCRELLAGRGLCVLALLLAGPLLDAAYMRYESPQRLLFVTGVYLMISFAIIWGAMPWRFRDFLSWLFRKPALLTNLGRGLAAYGALVILLAVTY